jgi:uroporphyrinogen-III decarboxylase
MPLSILTVGSARQVKDEVRRLINTCARGGGYIMMNGAVLDDVSPANVRAMIEATREYGTYK